MSKNVKKHLVFGSLVTIALFLIGFLLSNVKGYNLEDVFLLEGIISLIIGVFSAIEGNPMGLSIQGVGQSNAQYTSSATLEVNRVEKEKLKNVKSDISIGLLTIYLGISGILLIVVSLLIK